MEWLPCNTKNRLFTRSWTARVRFLYPWAGWKTHGGLWKSGWIWCMYVYICMYIYKHTYTREYMHTYIHMGICSWLCIYTHTYPCVGHHHSVSSWRNSNAGYYGKVDGYGVWHHVLWLWHCWYLCVYLIDILCGSCDWHHVLWLGHCWYLCMGWLWLVGSLKLWVSLAIYRLFYRVLLQKRPIILRSLLIVATPFVFVYAVYCIVLTYKYTNVYINLHIFLFIWCLTPCVMARTLLVFMCIFHLYSICILCGYVVWYHVLWLGHCWYLCIYVYICIHFILCTCTNIQIYTWICIFLYIWCFTPCVMARVLLVFMHIYMYICIHCILCTYTNIQIDT